VPTRSEKPLPELPLRKAFLETIKAQLAAELQARERENHIDWFYPDTGPLRRELYPNHLEFFGAGAVCIASAACWRQTALEKLKVLAVTKLFCI
jgi:hypothetical protein